MKIKRSRLRQVINEELRRVINEWSCPSPSITAATSDLFVRFEFDSGKSDIFNEDALNPSRVVSPVDEEDWACLIQDGLVNTEPGKPNDGDRFITIRAGTSGTGGDWDNILVANKRVDSAVSWIMNLLNEFGVESPTGRPYGVKYVANRVDEEDVADANMAGSTMRRGGKAPDDPRDPWFRRYQFVEIIVNSVVEPVARKLPDYGDLANAFLNAIGNWKPSYLTAPGGFVKKMDSTIVDVLRELDNADDFEKFNRKVEDYDRPKHRDFYKLACEASWWGYGPVEIGDIDEVQRELLRLKVDPIIC